VEVDLLLLEDQEHQVELQQVLEDQEQLVLLQDHLLQEQVVVEVVLGVQVVQVVV
tara:strand:+ start:114 stop:278 length:165 start_codon:yes stop_codon:yes gene_type:complete